MTFDETKMSVEDTILLNKIYNSNIGKFTGFIDKLSKKHKDDIFWYSNNIASRNIILSPFFFNLSLCLLIKIKIDSGKINKVIVEEGHTAKVIEKYVNSHNIKCRVISKNKYDKPQINIVKFVKSTLSYIKEKKTYTQMKSQMPTGSINLIHLICAYGQVRDGKCIDRLYTDIQKISSNKNIYFIPYFVHMGENRKSTPLIEIIKNAQEDKNFNFLVKEKFLTDFDYMFLFLTPLKEFAFKKKNLYFNGLEISILYNTYLNKELSSYGSYIGDKFNESILVYRFIKRLKKSGINVDNFVILFEGHGLDNAFSYGAHKFFPNSRTVGYYSSMIPKLYMSMSPSPEQMQSKSVPETIAVIGKKYERYIKRFCSDIKVKTVANVRDNVYKPLPNVEKKPRAVFVALTSFDFYNKYILEMITQYVRSGKMNDTKIYIKNHPNRKNMTLTNYGFGSNDFEHEFVGDPLIDVADKCSVVIASQTSFGLAILSRCVPLIFVEVTGKVSFNFIPKEVPKEMYSNIYTYEEFEKSMDYYLNEFNHSDYLKTREMILEDFFTPVNQETVDRIFERD